MQEVRAAGQLWTHTERQTEGERGGGLRDSTRAVKVKAEQRGKRGLPGRENCSKQHPFCATAMEIRKSALD